MGLLSVFILSFFDIGKLGEGGHIVNSYDILVLSSSTKVVDLNPTDMITFRPFQMFGDI